MPVSIPGRACQSSRSDFSVFFSETRVNTLGSLWKTPKQDTPPTGPGPTSGQLALNLQPNPTKKNTEWQGKRTGTSNKLLFFFRLDLKRTNAAKVERDIYIIYVYEKNFIGKHIPLIWFPCVEDDRFDWHSSTDDFKLCNCVIWSDSCQCNES